MRNTCVLVLKRDKYLSLLHPNEKYGRKFDRLKYLVIQEVVIQMCFIKTK